MILITLADVIVEIVDLSSMNHKYFSPADQESISRHIDTLTGEKFIFRYFDKMHEYSEYQMGNIKFFKKILPKNTEIEKLSIKWDLLEFIENLPDKQKDKIILEG